jgi:RNA 2',3'-cyclic 3'-phosphodiesterase
MLRLFVALPLPSAIRDRLSMIQTGVPSAKWVDPENLHLTLRFVGEVEDHIGHEVAAALDRVDAPGCDVRLTGVGHFGSSRRPTVLWAGVDRSDPLFLLKEKVDSAVRTAGIPPEPGRFRPHVTLARLPPATPAMRVGRWLENNGLFRTPPLAMTGFTLFASHLGSSRAIHTPLREYGLETADLL